jgi:RNA polymerase sigma-70 factor, ECF subfamily
MALASTTLAAAAPAVLPTAEHIAGLRGAVRRFIGARIESAATADDLTQDVFLKVMRQREHVRDPRRIMGWIFSIARHEVADHFRHARPTEEFQGKHDIAPSARLEVIDREETCLRDELASYVRSVVNQLPPQYREALLLTDYEGLSQVELAGHIGLSVSAAKSRVQRARTMAKAIIDRCCHFEVDRYGRVVDCQSRQCDCAATARK